MNFQESEEYLFSLGNEVEAMKLGLANIRKLLAALGDPQKSYLKVQVAGTNGKGSVCAFLDSICLQAEIKTGVFTSPHLVSITERVRIKGVDISEDEFARLATHVREVSESLVERGEIERVPTYFEQVTAIALVAFAEANVELAILETGLGGRYDAVTAANTEIAAITRIDLDHQQYLGETIEEIAAEKAAIIHEGSEVVVGEQVPAAMEVILERCRKFGIEPRLTSEIITKEASVPEIPSKSGFGVVGERRPNAFPKITRPLPGGGYRVTGLGLQGQHQTENARVAMLLAEILQPRFPITDRHVGFGLSRVWHPGRLEWIGKLLLDGAHNIGGAKALAAYLDEFVTEPTTLIFGAMRDKDVSEIAEILFPNAERIILTQPSNSRAMSAEELLKFAPNDFDAGKIVLTDSVREALEQAKAISKENSVILVTGSLYLVGEVKKLMNN